MIISLTACDLREYAIGIHNRTGQEVTDAHVRFGDFTSVGGTIIPGAFKVHLGVRRIPERVTVTWKISQTSYEREVDLTKLPTPTADQIIFFELLPDGAIDAKVRADLPKQGQ